VTKRLKTDGVDFPVDLDLEMVLGDMPRKVRIPWNVVANLLIFNVTFSHC